MNQIEEKDNSGANFNYLFVSFYLVILAFFILLNSIAKVHPEHSVEAMASIKGAFTDPRKGNKSSIIDSERDINGGLVLRNYLAPIGDVARSAVTLVDAEIVETGNTMIVTIPAKSFFLDNEAYIKPEQENFLQKLSEQLSKIEANSKIRVEFVIGSDPLNDYPTAQNSLELRRAGAFATTMTERKVEAESIAAGVSPGADKNYFSLIFIETPISETDLKNEKRKP